MEEALKLLLTYGPGGVIAGLVVLGILVPRSFYDREVKRGDTATDVASKNADAGKLVADALKVVTETNTGLRTDVSALREDLRKMREDFRVFRAGKGES